MTPSTWQRVIEQAMRNHLETIIAEEAAFAKQDVERRIREATASIVMECMSNFDVVANQQEIVIRVRNQLGEGR